MLYSTKSWNTQKSIWRIWQRFLCLLDEGIQKIWKKLNSHDGFLSYLQSSTANSARLAAHFCPALVLPSKRHHENSISFIFLESPHQVDMKNVVICYKHFFGYFNALKTHGVFWRRNLTQIFAKWPWVQIWNEQLSIWGRIWKHPQRVQMLSR